jgi:biotin carboxyl carrier protein
MKYIATIADQEFEIGIDREGEVTLDGEVIEAQMESMLDPTLHSLIVGHHSRDVRINVEEDLYTVQVGGEILEVKVEDERTRRLAGVRGSLSVITGEAVLKAPMPGVIVEVPVAEGAEVVKGDTVAILESMKMQNEIKAPRDGRVHAVRVAVGSTVDLNAIMLTIG